MGRKSAAQEAEAQRIAALSPRSLALEQASTIRAQLSLALLLPVFACSFCSASSACRRGHAVA